MYPRSPSLPNYFKTYPPEEGTYPEWPQSCNTFVSILSLCYLCSGTSDMHYPAERR